jgi:hypothetical protein
MRRAWVILGTVYFVAIFSLVVLAGIVYHRITMDMFSPPVYSIWARPGEKWHHAEFFISPTYGFQMTMDGKSIFDYGHGSSPNARRQQNDQSNSEDRPRLVASYLYIPHGVRQYYWTFENNGIEEATNITLKIATIDFDHAHHTLLNTLPNVLPRLQQGKGYPVTTGLPKNDLQFLVVCASYSNDRGTTFVDPPQFYLTPFYMQTNRETRSEPARVTPLQNDQLAAGFACANL